MAEKTPDNGEPVVIKKYANRRLYNTASSSYVTLEHLCQMVKDDVEFVVLDAKGNDITRSVLTQIIVEEEAKGENLLPLSFLRQLSPFMATTCSGCSYRITLNTLSVRSPRTRKILRHMEGRLGNLFPFGGQFEKMGKQHLENV